MRTGGRGTVLLVGAALAAAALAGCGGDSDTGSSTSGTPGSSTAWVLGEWRGELHQEGIAPFEVRATVGSLRDGSQNHVRYSGLDCRGTWTPLGGGSRAFRFREVITSGRSNTCKGAGTVTLGRGADRVAYSFHGGGVESRGALLPVVAGKAGKAAPEPRRDAMAQSAEVVGAPDREMVLSRVVVPPGATLALHHHLGTQVARVESGTLTYTVRRGSVVVRRGQSDQDPEVVRTIRAGETAGIRAGEWIVEQPTEIHRAANLGARPIVIYIATLLKAGAPPATPVGGG